VVVSSAVRDDNEEVVAARREQIPVIPRAEMLAELMRIQHGVAVAGSHGKTTVTSMIAAVLDEGGLDPTVVIGGRLEHLGSGARLGEGDLLVCEADESDGSFLRLTPTVAVVTNVDAEHLGSYEGSLDRLHDAFVEFMNRVPFYGAAVICLDDEALQEMIPRLDRRVITYGLSASADVRGAAVACEEFACHMELSVEGRHLGTVRIPLPGRHTALNALAAVAVGRELGVPFEKMRAALESLTVPDRRFEPKGEAGGVLVIEDYAHHPTEIRATLSAAREAFGRRILVLFQPHRPSRLRDLMEEFQRSFHEADVLVVTDLYLAGEEPVEGATSEALVRGVVERGHRSAAHAGGLDEAVARLVEEARPGDMVLVLGAGDVWKAVDPLLGGLSERRSA
jgi:UDP-N-acetylmuramate--alanine ligase